MLKTTPRRLLAALLLALACAACATNSHRLDGDFTPCAGDGAACHIRIYA